MALLNIPSKSTGDQFTAAELNEIVLAVQKLQSEKGHAVYFDDQYTDIAPQVITGTNYVAVENNKATAIENYLPYGINTLYDGTKLIPPSTGAGFTAYVFFFAKSNKQDSYFDFGVDIGGTSNEIFKDVNIVVKGVDTYQPYYMPLNGFMLDTFVVNGGVIKIKPKTTDTISIYGATFFLNIGYQQQ